MADIETKTTPEFDAAWEEFQFSPKWQARLARYRWELLSSDVSFAVPALVLAGIACALSENGYRTTYALVFSGVAYLLNVLDRSQIKRCHRQDEKEAHKAIVEKLEREKQSA